MKNVIEAEINSCKSDRAAISLAMHVDAFIYLASILYATLVKYPQYVLLITILSIIVQAVGVLLCGITLYTQRRWESELTRLTQGDASYE